MSDAAEQDPARIIVMNALAGALLDEGSVLADDASAELVLEAYRGAAADVDAAAFEAELAELTGLDAGEFGEPSPNFDRAVEATLSGLADRGVHARIDHRIEFEFTPRQALVYPLVRSLDPSLLEGSFLDESVAEDLAEPVRWLDRGDYAGAAARLGELEDSPTTDDGRFVRRLLEGWARFWAGEDEPAADIADELLHECDDCWEAKLLWMASTHERSYDVRSGALDLGLVVAWKAFVPEGGSFAVLFGTDPDAEDWEDVTNENGCVLFDRIGTTTRLAFRLEGTLPAFPTMPSYHVSVATTERWSGGVDEVERFLRTGPIADDGVETLRLSV